jgi:hypothetical protein
MNFKTTILLLIALLVVGTYFFVSQRGPKPTPPTPDTLQPGQGPKLVDVSSSNVKGIIITDDEGKRTSVRQEGAAWKMTEPVEAPAVDWQTTDLIRTICDLRSQGRPDATPSDTGLDKPMYTVELTDNDGKSTKLIIGNKTGVGDVMYAQVNGGEANLIDSSVAKQLKTVAADLRDKHLITMPTSDVKQIRIVSPGQMLAMQKDGDQWKITSPDQIPGDGDSISSLISSITGTEATEFLTSEDEQLPFARFDHPTMEIFMSSEVPTTQPTTQPVGVTLTIGAPDSLAKDHYFARTSDGLIAKIAKSSLDSLQKTPLDLRDRDVTTVAAADVTAVSVLKESYPPPSTQPSKSTAATKPSATKFVGLVRRPKAAPKALGPTLATSKPTTAPTTQPESVWMFTDDRKAQVDDSKVDTLLAKFAPLKADKFVEKASNAAWDTRFIVTLQTGPQQTYHMEVIKPSGGGTPYALYNGHTFEVAQALLDALDVDFHKTP